MSLSKYSLIQYNGTNVGALYLLDVQQRPQLGSGQQYTWGQDIVVNHNDVIGLVNTGAVLMSETQQNLGILYTWSQPNSEKLAAAVEAAGGIVVRNSGLTGTQASLNGQPTGLAAPLTITMVDSLAGLTGSQTLVRSGVTGATRKTDPVHSVGDF